MPVFIDDALLGLALALPPVLVLVMKRRGVFWGATFMWVALIIADEVQRTFDPLIPIALGWFVGALYCSPFALGKLIYVRLRHGHACGSIQPRGFELVVRDDLNSKSG